MRTVNMLMVLLGACFVHSAFASDAIRPYLKTGKSGQFSYAIYNNRWLLHGRQWADEKHLTRVAITDVLPGAEGKLVIPSSIGGHEVYGIDEKAFEACLKVTAVVIPGTVRFLRPGTLNRCRGLKTIVVAEDHPEFASVDGVMFDKEKTTLLAFGSGRGGRYEVPGGTTAIGPGAFSRCWLLTSVVIPESVTDIGGHTGGVFQECRSLERIEMADTVTNIGQKSFQDCNSLREVAIPPKVTAIPFGLFWRCSNLTKVALPDGITSVGNYAFADCGKVTLEGFPKGLTKIGAYAFKNCRGLKGLAVPKSVTTIERGAFQGCEVILPKGDDA